MSINQNPQSQNNSYNSQITSIIKNNQPLQQSRFRSKISQIVFTYSSKLYEEQLKTITKINDVKLLKEEQIRGILKDMHQEMVEQIKQKKQILKNIQMNKMDKLSEYFRGYQILLKNAKIIIDIRQYVELYHFLILKNQKNQIHLSKIYKKNVLQKIIKQCLYQQQVLVFNIKWNLQKDTYAIKLIEGKPHLFNLQKQNFCKYIRNKQNLIANQLIFKNINASDQQIPSVCLPQIRQIKSQDQLIDSLKLVVKLEQKMTIKMVQQNYEGQDRQLKYIIQDFLINEYNIISKYENYFDLKEIQFQNSKSKFVKLYKFTELCLLLQIRINNFTIELQSKIKQDNSKQLINNYLQKACKANTIHEKIEFFRLYFTNLLNLIEQSNCLTKQNVLQLTILILIYGQSKYLLSSIKMMEHYFIIQQSYQNYFGSICIAIQFISNFKHPTNLS